MYWINNIPPFNNKLLLRQKNIKCVIPASETRRESF
jgi:hypothetical protein